jgi:lipopolysaccharide export system ATP-binding protein
VAAAGFPLDSLTRGNAEHHFRSLSTSVIANARAIMELLRAENLVKSYKKRTVVNHASFSVEGGEIVGLLGPNGAGKTTAFRMIIGLIRPEAGKVLLNGAEITRLPIYQRARRGMGYLAQEPSIF